MILKRQIALRAIVTENLKEALVEELEGAIRQIGAEQDELDRQTRRVMLELQRTDLNKYMQVRQQLDAEKRRQDAAKAELQERIEAVKELPLGEEVLRGTIEGQITIAVGDNFAEKMGAAEILLEDDIVKEIRDPAA